MGLALAATVFKLGADLFGAVGRRRAADRQFEFAKQMANDVIARGEREAEFATMDLSRLRGAQTTSIAAQGIDTTQGSAAQIAEQTQRFGEEDINQIRLNAAREAWGIKTQAKLNRTAGRNQAFAEGLSGVAEFAGDYMEIRDAQKKADDDRAKAGLPPRRTLLNRAADAWNNYTSRRR
jgi:hypothetical protein